MTPVIQLSFRSRSKWDGVIQPPSGSLADPSDVTWRKDLSTKFFKIEILTWVYSPMWSGQYKQNQTHIFKINDDIEQSKKDLSAKWVIFYTTKRSIRHTDRGHSWMKYCQCYRASSYCWTSHELIARFCWQKPRIYKLKCQDSDYSSQSCIGSSQNTG